MGNKASARGYSGWGVKLYHHSPTRSHCVHRGNSCFPFSGWTSAHLGQFNGLSLHESSDYIGLEPPGSTFWAEHYGMSTATSPHSMLKKQDGCWPDLVDSVGRPVADSFECCHLAKNVYSNLVYKTWIFCDLAKASKYVRQKTLPTKLHFYDIQGTGTGPDPT